MTEPTLAATRAAAEQVRAANHAAYDAPKGTPVAVVNVYDRAGAVHELLTYVQGLITDLSRHTDRLVETPGLESTNGVDGLSAAHHARHAALRIRQAAEHVADAADQVNMAWSELSPLFVNLPDNDEEDAR